MDNDYIQYKKNINRVVSREIEPLSKLESFYVETENIFGECICDVFITNISILKQKYLKNESNLSLDKCNEEFNNELKEMKKNYIISAYNSYKRVYIEGMYDSDSLIKLYDLKWQNENDDILSSDYYYIMIGKFMNIVTFIEKKKKKTIIKYKNEIYTKLNMIIKKYSNYDKYNDVKDKLNSLYQNALIKIENIFHSCKSVNELTNSINGEMILLQTNADAVFDEYFKEPYKKNTGILKLLKPKKKK